jgi:CheY-like chemotaxis protein
MAHNAGSYFGESRPELLMSAARPLGFRLDPLPSALSAYRRSILYLDDDWQNLADWCATLEHAGYDVTATDSPAAGLSAFLARDFDAVVLNFHLPYVSSGLLAQVIHNFRWDTPLLLISDSREDEDLSPWDRRLSEGATEAQLLAHLQAVMEHAGRARAAAALMAALPPLRVQ